MAITKIRIPALWDGGDGEQIAVAEFKLGMGPCGKNVIRLTCDIRPDGVMVSQTCEAGCKEVKDFFYPTATLTGRVEITREPSYSHYYVRDAENSRHYGRGYSNGFAAGERVERRKAEMEKARKWYHF